MATTPDLQEPQIAAARAKAWHQSSDPEAEKNPLLTLEAARHFVQEHGLILFAPRPLGAPAPSLVEATLGVARVSTTPAEAEIARGLVARLVAEGSALPLNLLGGPGEVPDFIVSAAAFPFVFTLRGDKGWKRPPETSGAVKVTPLALRVYELLVEKGAMTVADMVPEVGREVTDSAILRSLNELWAMLRVLPAAQQGQGDTLWELTTARFGKAVKAGANAGQPTALSAIISLYLGQAYVASEEEIASFLSPLTARSRVRDVLHGLTAGRQLSEAVIEGKAVLYIPDALPDFAQLYAESNAQAEPDVELEAELDAELDHEPDAELDEGADEPTDATADFDETIGADGEAEGAELGDGTESGDGTEPPSEGSRIRRFDAGAAAPMRGKPMGSAPLAGKSIAGKSMAGKPMRGKPATRDGAPGNGFRSGPPAGTRTGPRPATPRGPRTEGDRPRSTGGYQGGADRTERPSRPPYSQDRAKRSFDGSAPRSRPSDDRSSRPGAGRPPSDRPAFNRPWEDRPSRPAGEGARPSREGSEGRPFRPARPRDDSRPPVRRESTGDRPPFRREGGSDRPPFRRDGEAGGGARPPFRREGSSDRPPFRRDAGGDRPPFRRREEGEGDRPARRPYTPGGPSFGDRAPRGDRPSLGDRAPRSDRPSFGDRPRAPRPPSDRPYTPRSYEKREGSGDSRPPRRDGGGSSFNRPGGDRPSFPRREGSSADRPSFSRPRSGDGAGPDRGPSRGFSRDTGGRPPYRGASGDSRGPARSGGDGAGRPPFRPRPAGGPGAGSGGGFGGGFNRGPRRDAPGGKFSPRGAGNGPSRGRPASSPSAPSAPKRKPEDEA